MGLALSDALGITAQGLPTLDARKTKDVFAHLENLIKDEDVGKVIVGMPKSLNGTIGPKGMQVQEFIQELANRTNVEVIPWDERLTSVQSLRTMKELGVKQKRKEVVDRISAALILQSYLDSTSSGSEECEAS